MHYDIIKIELKHLHTLIKEVMYNSKIKKLDYEILQYTYMIKRFNK